MARNFVPKPVQLFPTLNNIEDFLQQDHPSYDPRSRQYEDYWSDVERKVIEGLWGFDYDKKTNQGGYRYMPGPLWVDTNLGTVEYTAPDQSTYWAASRLRDVDWYLGYDWFVCNRFSGMEDDRKYTCNFLVSKIENEMPLTPTDKVKLDMFADDLKAPDGSWKKYVNPLKYLYATHKEPKGLPLYQNPSLDMGLLTTRGIGKSFKLTNMVMGHKWISLGATRYDARYLDMNLSVTMTLSAASSGHSQPTVEKFQEFLGNLQRLGSYRYTDDVTGEVKLVDGWFHMNTTGNLSHEDAKPYTHKFNARIMDRWMPSGSGTSIYHTIIPPGREQNAVGRRGFIIGEEVGLIDYFEKYHGAVDAIQKRDGERMFPAIYAGTGGNMKKVQGIMSVFINPTANQMLAHHNKFEPSGGLIGTFVPYSYTIQALRDEMGNLNYVEAHKQALTEREDWKRKSPQGYEENRMSYPLYPSEMYVAAGGSKWPVEEIAKRKIYLMSGDKYKLVIKSTGELHANVEAEDPLKTVRFESKPLHLAKPVLHFPEKQDTNRYGALVVYEPPPSWIYDMPRNTFNYKVVYDVIKKDEDGSSLACIQVWKNYVPSIYPSGLQKTLVAEILFRRKKRIIHDYALALALWYHTKVFYENNYNDFEIYCQEKKLTYLLQHELSLITGQPLRKQSGEYNWGITMNGSLMEIADQHLNDDILMEERKCDENGEPVILGIDYLCSLRGCDEFLNYSENGNFDWISAARLYSLWDMYEKLTLSRSQADEKKPAEHKGPPPTMIPASVRHILDHIKKQHEHQQQLAESYQRHVEQAGKHEGRGLRQRSDGSSPWDFTT